MKETVKHKYEFNKKYSQKNDFSRGYVDGVKMQKLYSKLSPAKRNQYFFDYLFDELNKAPYSYRNGFVSARRDIDNEKKVKTKKGVKKND